MTSWRRLTIAAALGAVGGAMSLVVAFWLHPAFILDMDRDLPRMAFGFYPPETTSTETFAWTSERAQLNLVDFSRRTDWRCTVVFRGGRPPGMAQPFVSLVIDGVVAGSRPATNDYQTLAATVPARPNRRGLNVAVVASPTFVPGPADPRALGVQVDRLTCAPLRAVAALPSRGAIVDAAAIAGLFGLAFVLAGVALWTAVGGAVTMAVTQAIPLSIGPAPYGSYPDRAFWLALWIVLVMVGAVRLLEAARRQRLHHSARFAVTVSAGVLFMKLLGLLHPSKPIIDAVFHAHRLEWVMGGRYFFTQPMPNGVEFPYAIALYLIAAPWAALTNNHVALLRIVVCAADVCAGGLLYWTIVRNWNDRLAAAAAVLFFSVVPLPFVVLGNANLTNAFGQSMALITIVMATTLTLDLRRVLQVGALTAVAAIALLSHVSTFALLLTTLVALAAAYWRIGGRALRPAGLAVGIAAVAAAVLAVAMYYGHFIEVYRHLNRAAAEPGVSATVTTIGARLAGALALSVSDVGWPLLILAGAGAWRSIISRGRDRLTCALAAYALTYAVFLAFGIVVPVGASLQRYVVEFISRVDYATYPAAVVLAARGAAWAWRAGPIGRATSSMLVAWSVATGVIRWLEWFR